MMALWTSEMYKWAIAAMVVMVCFAVISSNRRRNIDAKREQQHQRHMDREDRRDNRFDRSEEKKDNRRDRWRSRHSFPKESRY